MDICQGIHTIRKILVDKDKLDIEKLCHIEYCLPQTFDYCFVSMKDLILKTAEQLPNNKFRLLACMNNGLNIFNWCDLKQNFIGMNSFPEFYEEREVEYSLTELPDVIANAEKWLKSVKENNSMSGSPYFISPLQIMVIR